MLYLCKIIPDGYISDKIRVVFRNGSTYDITPHLYNNKSYLRFIYCSKQQEELFSKKSSSRTTLVLLRQGRWLGMPLDDNQHDILENIIETLKHFIQISKLQKTKNNPLIGHVFSLQINILKKIIESLQCDLKDVTETVNKGKSGKDFITKIME